MYIGEKCIYIRELFNCSQEEMAQALNIDLEQINHFENDDLTPEEIKNVAELYRIPAEYFQEKIKVKALVKRGRVLKYYEPFSIYTFLDIFILLYSLTGIAMIFIIIFLFPEYQNICWLPLFSSPVLATFFNAIRKRNPVIFFYPGLALIIMLFFGLQYNQWEIGTYMVVTIPGYYALAIPFNYFVIQKKHKQNQSDNR